MTPIRQVTIVFEDGSSLIIIIPKDDDKSNGHYKKENFNGLFDTHSVFIAGGIERDIPGFKE